MKIPFLLILGLGLLLIADGQETLDRFELRFVGSDNNNNEEESSSSAYQPIAILRSAAPMDGTVFFEHNPLISSYTTVNLKLQLYGMIDVDAGDEDCETGVLIEETLYETEILVEDETIPQEQTYTALYPNSVNSFPSTTNGQIGHFRFYNLNIWEQSAHATNRAMLDVCSRVGIYDNENEDETQLLSWLDTRFRMVLKPYGSFSVGVAPLKEKEIETPKAIVTQGMTFDAPIPEIDLPLFEAAIQAAMTALILGDISLSQGSVVGNRRQVEETEDIQVSTVCVAIDCSPNYCYVCTTTIEGTLDAIENAAETLVEIGEAAIDDPSILQALIVEALQEAGIENVGILELEPMEVTIVSNFKKVNIAVQESLLVRPYLCDPSNNNEIDASILFQQGQDFKICVEPQEQVDENSFVVTRFQNVQCAGGTNVRTLIDADGNALDQLTIIDSDPHTTNGALGFEHIVLKYYLEGGNNSVLSCTGQVILSNDSSRKLLAKTNNSQNILYDPSQRQRRNMKSQTVSYIGYVGLSEEEVDSFSFDIRLDTGQARAATTRSSLSHAVAIILAIMVCTNMV